MRSTSSRRLRSPGRGLALSLIRGLALLSPGFEAAGKGRQAEDQRSQEIVAGHRDAEQRPGDLVATHDRLGLQAGAQLVDADRAADRRAAARGAGPPMLLDADMERGDARSDEQGEAGGDEERSQGP